MRGIIQKTYNHRVVAENDKLKADPLLKSKRVDVVEISRSARIHLENKSKEIK